MPVAAASEVVAPGLQWNLVLRDLFAAPDDAFSDDPVVDVVRHNPDAAVRYLTIVMALSGFGALLSCTACISYLLLYWQPSAVCGRPLRWWLLLYSMLQLLQAPVRFVFIVKLHQAEREGSSLEACATSLTASLAWRLSKGLSLFTYGWFVLGITWLTNAGECSECPGVYWLTVFVMAQAAARTALTLVLFRVLFLHSEPDVDDEPKVQGATPQQIQELQALRFAPGLFEEEVDASCAVCLSEYSHGEMLRRLPCGHHFHCQCADEWLHRSKQCPLCRQEIDAVGEEQS